MLKNNEELSAVQGERMRYVKREDVKLHDMWML